MVAHLDEHMLPISSPRPELIDSEDLTQETPPEAVTSKQRARGGGTVGASTKQNRKKSTPTQGIAGASGEAPSPSKGKTPEQTELEQYECKLCRQILKKDVEFYDHVMEQHSSFEFICKVRGC